MDLAIDADGKPNASAAVMSIKQVKVSSTRLVPGKYTDGVGGTCNVTAATLPDGRQEGAISCSGNFGGYEFHWNASVVNGSIAGHPFELQLNAAGIGDINGYQNYMWGLEGASTYSDRPGICFSTNDIVSARQVGTQINVTNYGKDNVSDCGLTMTQMP